MKMASWFLCGARVGEIYRVEMLNETKKKEEKKRWNIEALTKEFSFSFQLLQSI